MRDIWSVFVLPFDSSGYDLCERVQDYHNALIFWDRKHAFI